MRIIYISGIALQLSKYEKLPAIEIATKIASHICTNHDKNFKIQIVSPGWIHLEVAHQLLASWLQGLTIRGVEERDREITVSDSSTLFTVQYTHARCCSLVRLAIQEGLIQPETNPDHTQSFQHKALPRIISPNPLPWLNGDQIRFDHPASFSLIHELVRAIDTLECSDGDSVNWEKTALGLSRAFETFWCKCRIFDEVKTTSLELAQARIGLVLATQFVLKSLLEEKLSIFALNEV